MLLYYLNGQTLCDQKLKIPWNFIASPTCTSAGQEAAVALKHAAARGTYTPAREGCAGAVQTA